MLNNYNNFVWQLAKANLQKCKLFDIRYILHINYW